MKSIILKKKEYFLDLAYRYLKWNLKYFFLGRPSPLSCGIYITNKCNFHCDFCTLWRKQTILTLPLEKAKQIVDALNKLGCFYCSITGGEPLLVNYIFDFLKYVKKSKIRYLHMVTNGYALDKERALQLNQIGLDEISISLDGDEEMHDNHRKTKGAYRQAIEAIENIKKFAPNVSIVLNTILFPENLEQVLNVIKIANDFDVYMKVQPLNRHPLFTSVSIENIQTYAPAKQEKSLKKIIDILCRERCIVNSPAFLTNIYNFYFRKDKLLFHNLACLLGYHHIEILENGEIFPCLEGMEWNNGLQFDNNLEEIVASKNYLQLLKKLKNCDSCKKNYYICYYEPRVLFPITNFIRHHNYKCFR